VLRGAVTIPRLGDDAQRHNYDTAAKEYVPAKRLSLKTSPVYNEKWLQQLIIDDPTILGLGEVTVRDVERPQPRAGRLDLLLSDLASGTRYEVEIQLGSTDESHIVRTVEYWDIERVRYPQFEHVAVLVAENITSRFLNVIALFNKAIPIVAIQISALEVGDRMTVNATTVLDLMPRGTDEEDEPGQVVDRSYWETRASAAMESLDALERLVQEAIADPTIALKYNKGYVGLARNGSADNFVYFQPRKNGRVLTGFRLEPSNELEGRLDEAGLDLATGYDPRRGRYYIRLTEADLGRNRELLTELVRQAAELPTAPDE
jgi:hypothetical protein